MSATHTHFHFDGFEELIEKPLEHSDPRSLDLIRKLLSFKATSRPRACIFVFLIEALSDVTVSQREARTHWKKILDHKRRLELALNRVVHIKTAAIDYYDQLGIILDPITEPGVRDGGTMPGHTSSAPEVVPADATSPPPEGQGRVASAGHHGAFSAFPVATVKEVGSYGVDSDGLLERVSVPGLHQERLKEEMLRARRYKHALSAIMLDIDLLQAGTTPPAIPAIKNKVFAIIIKMIFKAVRTVDILARHTENDFLLILPNTNKREAIELAERLRNNISQRTHRIPELTGGVQVTISVGQCSKDDTSSDFIKRLENRILSGKRTEPNTVHTLE